MKRNEVSAKLKEVNKSLDELRDTEVHSLYYTKDKFLPKVGHIHEVRTIQDLVIAHNHINEQTESEFGDSMKALGITDDEIETPEVKILGFSAKYWIKDIETRLEALRMDTKYDKLNKAKSVLEKYLTDDDKFDSDMEILDGLV